MISNPVAVFTFFSKTTCGYCKQFKGEITDNKGGVKIDPNSGWEVLTSDLDLQNAGIEMQLYSFGPEKDPKTGQVINRVLDDAYLGKITGVPYLELSIPNDPYNGIQFKEPFKSWKANDVVPVIKKWIFSQLKKEPFKSYAEQVRSGKPPGVKVPNQTINIGQGGPMPNHISKPQNKVFVNPENQEDLIKRQMEVRTTHESPSANIPDEDERKAPSTFGLGTTQIRNNIIKPDNTKFRKPPAKFLPSNYEN